MNNGLNQKPDNIFNNIQTRQFKRGEIIFKEGDQSDGRVYFILSGKAAVVKQIDQKQTIIHSMHSNDIFGEVALVTNKERIATIIAESEELKVACFDGQAFLKEARSNPKFARRLVIAALTVLDRIETRSFSNGKFIQMKENLLAEYNSLMEPLRNGNLHIQSLLYRSTIKVLAKDSIIFREGQENDNFTYLLINGEVCIEVLNNNKKIECMRFREGEWLGEVALLRKAARHYTVRVVSAQAKILFLDKIIFFKIMQLDPQLLFNVFKTFILHLSFIERSSVTT
ncbi:MAG: cyclic nucleotide-binding domain-containing protein [Leptonema sp. (in: Bacteria)]|nr:cyclic nucleotide-binding domain-containing protein [Leptonema sp. (in: bacteria)]